MQRIQIVMILRSKRDIQLGLIGVTVVQYRVEIAMERQIRTEQNRAQDGALWDPTT